MTPKVTIGMPVYNGDKHIREALDSLLAQTFTDLELVISDNASTDSTEAICRGYAARDPRVRYVRQAANRGYIANFHFVLNQGAGEYFMWAAADDYWDRDWVDTLLKRFDPGTAVAFGSVVSVQSGGRQANVKPLKAICGPRTLRMVRYYLWTNSASGKAEAIYGLYRTAELRSIAGPVLAQSDDRFGYDNIVVFTMLQVGCLRIEPSVRFYKRTRPVCGFQPIAGGMLQKLRQLGPHFIEHIRRSPPGITRFAVAAVTPIKYVWQIWRGVRRAAILLVRAATGKKLTVGEL